MAGSVLIIVILALAPIVICMGGAVIAAILGHFLDAERAAAFEGTERLEIAKRG